MKLLDDSQAGTCAFEDFEEQTQGGLYLCIRVEDDVVLRIVYESDRRRLFKLSTASATQDATAQPCLEYMQLCFTHRAL